MEYTECCKEKVISEINQTEASMELARKVQQQLYNNRWIQRIPGIKGPKGIEVRKVVDLDLLKI